MKLAGKNSLPVKDLGVELVEQPLAKDNWDDMSFALMSPQSARGSMKATMAEKDAILGIEASGHAVPRMFNAELGNAPILADDAAMMACWLVSELSRLPEKTSIPDAVSELLRPLPPVFTGKATVEISGGGKFAVAQAFRDIYENSGREGDRLFSRYKVDTQDGIRMDLQDRAGKPVAAVIVRPSNTSEKIAPGGSRTHGGRAGRAAGEGCQASSKGCVCCTSRGAL